MRMDLYCLLERIATADDFVTARCTSCGEFRVAFAAGRTLITHGRIIKDQPIELVASTVDHLYEINSFEVRDEIIAVILNEGDCADGTELCTKSVGPMHPLC